MRGLGLDVVEPETFVNILRTVRTFVAHNAAFDRGITKAVLRLDIPPERWSCTMARSMRLGLPASLENVGEVLHLGDRGKDMTGNRLIKQISKPRPAWSRWEGLSPEDKAKRKRKTPPEMWYEDADRLARAAAYCAQDTRATTILDYMLPELEPSEWAIWQHVNTMNETGIPLDRELIAGALRINEETITELTDRILYYTRGAVSSLRAIEQLVNWSYTYHYPMDSWDRESVANALDDPQCPEPVRIVALARLEAAKGSVAKFETAARMVSPDGRVRHQVVYWGTSTGRLAGRAVQPLNLLRPKIIAEKFAAKADIKAGRPIRVASWKVDYDPEYALHAIRRGDTTALKNIGDPEEILADHIRAMIEAPSAPKPKRIVSPDLSAIEARGVFWLSNCRAALDAYKAGIDLYCDLASEMFGFPVDKKKNPEERQFGKVGILQCGYGSGATRVSEANKIPFDLAIKIVKTYRGKYSEVPHSWYDLEDAAICAVLNPGYVLTACSGRVSFVFSDGWLRINRPSGVVMYLPDAGVDDEGRLFYHAWIRGAWRRESIWGGVLINFVVQGFCRDLMFEAEMKIAQMPEYEIFLQTYDSLTALVDQEQAQELCDRMIAVMTTPPAWAPDMPLAAEGGPKLRYS